MSEPNPAAGDRQALIERLRGYQDPHCWNDLATDALLAAESLRQADKEITKLYRERMQVDRALASVHEEIERVKKERNGWIAEYEREIRDLNKATDAKINAAADRLARAEASLSVVTLRNEKLREALRATTSELGNLLAMVEGEVPSLLEDHFSWPFIKAALEAGDAALQLSPDPATPQETKA